jgi:hypothetical protein
VSAVRSNSGDLQVRKAYDGSIRAPFEGSQESYRSKMMDPGCDYDSG